MQPNTQPSPPPEPTSPDAAVEYIEQIARQAALEAYHEAQVNTHITSQTKRLMSALHQIAEASGLDPLTVLEQITASVRKSQAATPPPQEACKQCHGRGFYRLPYRFTGQASDYAECDLCESRHSAPSSQASATTSAADGSVDGLPSAGASINNA